MLDGHAVSHESTHREASEEDAVVVDLAVRHQRVEECEEESRIVGRAAETGVPHGVALHAESLRHHDDPTITLGQPVEVHLAVATRNVVAQAV